jgi:hypothetical protein
MPNDYLANKFNTTDTFWKIDTVTGKKDRPLEANQITGQYDAAQLFFNTDESQLFFVNKGDGKIMRIDL